MIALTFSHKLAIPLINNLKNDNFSKQYTKISKYMIELMFLPKIGNVTLFFCVYKMTKNIL